MTPDFFIDHPHFALTLLVFLAFFPRITLLVASFATGGLLWWVGWLFGPHVLVAFLALPYWHSNPVLVAIACGWAPIGTLMDLGIGNSWKGLFHLPSTQNGLRS